MSQEKPHESGKVAPGDTSQRVGVETIRERRVDVDELLSKERDGEVNPAGHVTCGEPSDAPYSTNNRFNDSA